MYMCLILTNSNNAVLAGQRAMPIKDTTTNGTNTFALYRYAFTRSHSEKPTAHKKWIGGNRDASQIISNRRMNTTANGSLNSSGNPMSFTSKNDSNVQRNALHRTRSGGARVPAKVTHTGRNQPVFYD